jgi:hypothetical protein
MFYGTVCCLKKGKWKGIVYQSYVIILYISLCEGGVCRSVVY